MANFVNIVEPVDARHKVVLPAGDYASPGLKLLLPDSLFPFMQIGDHSDHPWPYLRRDIPHNWYVDRRFPLTGFLSRDEAILLHNIALAFKGRPALEIGCWMGWSTYHLAAAGVRLDVIDPILNNSTHLLTIESALREGGFRDAVRLYPVRSPAGVDEIGKLMEAKWSLFFIDGDHEDNAPTLDAEVCLKYAAKEAMVVFHDLASPFVARGLELFHQAGWRTMVYQTMQVIGVAWRGSTKPPCHIADPTVDWDMPAHLAAYPVSGIEPEDEIQRLAHFVRRLSDEKQTLTAGREESEIASAAATAEFERVGRDLAAARADGERLQVELTSTRGEVKDLQEELATAVAELERLRAQIAAPGLRLAARAVNRRMRDIFRSGHNILRRGR
jgi:hypothetical protein